MMKSVLSFAFNGYSEEGSDEEFGVEMAPPKKPEVRREYYETDYKDLKASLSSIFALPPKFPFSGQHQTKTQRFAKDLLRSNKRSVSETKLVGLEDVRNLDLRLGRRYSCSCTACGGYRLAQKFLISQIPRCEGGGAKPIKPKVVGLDGLMMNIQSINTKSVMEHLPSLIGIGKFKTLAPVRRQKLVASPPKTPRLHQLLDQIRDQEIQAKIDLKQRIRKKRLIWQRIQSSSQMSVRPSNRSLKSTQSCGFHTPSSVYSDLLSTKSPRSIPSLKTRSNASKTPKSQPNPRLRAFTQLIRRV